MATPSTATSYDVKKRVFDLVKFEKVTLTGNYSFAPVQSVQDAIARIGNDQSKLLNLLNEALRRQAMRDAKASLASSDAGSSKVVNQFVSTFRLMPQFASIQDKKEQTQAIYSFIKSTPAMFEGIKAAAIAALATDEEEEDEENES
jgi:hypothetical protein